jgi:HK97 family phage major capsid protein
MEVADLVKTVKEATDALTAAHADNQENVKRMVEETIKSVLRAHPGVTPQRTISFGEQSDRDEVLKSLPKEVQHEADKIYLLSSIMKVPAKSLKSWGNFRRVCEAKASDFIKALDSTTAGGVDEWVPTEMSASLQEKVRLQLKVASLFPTIQMPSNPYELPIEVGDINSFYLPEQTADTGQTLIPVGDTSSISGKVTFSAKALSTRVLMSKESAEDSIVPLLPLIQNRIVLALAQGREDLILNGDTAGSHEDTDTSSATSRRKGWLGLRAMSNDQSYTRDLSTLSETNLLDLRADMGIYGVNPADLVFVTSIKGYIALMKIDAVTTLEKFGPNAVILQGQLGSIAGIPIVVSEFVRSDLNASAVYEASATKTVIHCVHRNAFAIGERSRISTQLLTELYAASNQNALLANERLDFQPVYPIASNRVVNTGINVG